jgi:hypothetical protein
LAVILAVSISSGSWNVSTGRFSLKNNFSLNVANSLAVTPTSSFYFLHKKPQKRLGWYFKISGVELANSFRPLKQTF